MSSSTTGRSRATSLHRCSNTALPAPNDEVKSRSPDTVAPPKDTTNLVNKLHEQKGIKTTHELIEGADHFFKDDEAHMKPMIDTVSSYVKRRLGEASR